MDPKFLKKIFKYFLILFFVQSSLSAKSIKCNFEEVYPNQQIQEGLILIQNEKIRYEYSDKNLYTLLYTSDLNLYLVENQNRENIQAIESNKEIFSNLLKLYDQYPNLNNSINIDEFQFTIEKSEIFNFFKRIAVKSKQVNFSLYFHNCDQIEIDYKLFNPRPFKEIIF